MYKEPGGKETRSFLVLAGKHKQLHPGGMRSINTPKVLSQPTQPVTETGATPKTIPKPNPHGLALKPAKPHVK